MKITRFTEILEFSVSRHPVPDMSCQLIKFQFIKKKIIGFRINFDRRVISKASNYYFKLPQSISRYLPSRRMKS